jgi:hypothetical protein
LAVAVKQREGIELKERAPLNNADDSEAPPLEPELPPEQVAQMSPKETADYLARVCLASLNRYKGRPDLLLKENPHRDFNRFHRK